ncbi:hypothetical protein PUN28_010813 [Cardiocondyla obscurior]|uniref:Uncharacterized protein n=1 Tax=Cardiocondyla obscurior TaxID=286306 RepID=A0AAW2FNM4_9HYME
MHIFTLTTLGCSNFLVESQLPWSVVAPLISMHHPSGRFADCDLVPCYLLKRSVITNVFQSIRKWLGELNLVCWNDRHCIVCVSYIVALITLTATRSLYFRSRGFHHQFRSTYQRH